MRRLLALLVLVAISATARSGGSDDPPTPLERARAAVDSGIRYLLETQNEDGSWGYHAQESPYMIYAPVPGAHRAFRAATTALVLMALRRSPRSDEAIESARKRGLLWLLENGRVKRSDAGTVYGVWAWTYGLTCLARYLESPVPGVEEDRVRQAAAAQVKALGIYQGVDGGWGYFDFRIGAYHPGGESMSFITSTALNAMYEARRAGIAVPDRVVRRAVRSLGRCRTPEKTYVYSFNWRYYPAGGINRPQGALTRKPGCDLALLRFGAGPTVEDLSAGVRNLLEKRAFSRMALHRPVPHESWFQVSGYFHLFGVMNAAECFALLDASEQDEFRDGLIEEALVTRDRDGSFWDYPLYGYHKPYGTAYALLALQILAPAE